jgi:hypothetical protein
MKHSTLLLFTLFGISLVPVGAAAAEPPTMKPGLWEIRIQHASDGRVDVKPATMQHCKSASEIARSQVTAADYAKKNCSKNETRQQAGKWVSDMVCKVGASTMTSHTVTDVTGDTAYHSESTSNIDPPTPGHARSTTIFDGKWLGTCKPG